MADQGPEEFLAGAAGSSFNDVVECLEIVTNRGNLRSDPVSDRGASLGALVARVLGVIPVLFIWLSRHRTRSR